MDIDTEINRFLDWWEEHGQAPSELRVSDWVIRTPGCEGDFGCCSQTHDLSGLVDALYELADRAQPGTPSGVSVAVHRFLSVSDETARQITKELDQHVRDKRASRHA